MIKYLSILCLLSGFLFLSKAAFSHGYMQNSRLWNAKWISEKSDEGLTYGVYHFRKSIELAGKPESFVIHVSADNRYKLYVNGQVVSMGPARGDLHFWNYETVDIAPYLVSGQNVVSALVWNEAEYRPEAQISLRTAFIVQGHSASEEILNTNGSWKCVKSHGHHPIPGFFFAASKGELVDMNQTIKDDWHAVHYDDHSWSSARELSDGKTKGTSDGWTWQLVPSPLPQMELSYERLVKLRAVSGMEAPVSFPAKKENLTIPANRTVTLLLDQTYMTNAYVTLLFSKGKGAGISLGYAETLYDRHEGDELRKSNRNEVENKIFVGRIDSLLADGTENQTFTTLNYRTYRYLRLIVSTSNEPLIIKDLYGTFTGYPFKQNYVLNTGNSEIDQILDIGWRTARLNAWETYMDCPYYEQLQYIGDTRIQAMISYYNSGDDRLARYALDLMDRSRLTEGVTMSRYPTRGTQIISTFSLWYIGMLHDYWMYRPDSDFIKEKLTGQRAILEFFEKLQQPDGSIKDLPYWRFVDWVGDMGWGPMGPDGSAAIYDLQLLLAYQWASEMEAAFGLTHFATYYEEKAAQLKATIKNKYWDGEKKLFADTKEKKGFSQHANSLAILAGLIGEQDLATVGNSLLQNTELTPCTIYFKYYLHQALAKAGLGDDYMNWLGIWRENIQMGLSTWAEDSRLQTVRSECHAWGASPNIEFFRIVLGIDTDAPGFARVKIEPRLGIMTDVRGEMPHPNGKISVHYKQQKNKWKISVNLPEKTTGKFIWKGQIYALEAGSNILSLGVK
ncbi:alpha-L-rhamnosidase-related protein [Sphingobacterium arenae]|uniref:Alpha-L-rhamnosidase N-terminal domain-containing protein n=1 Tax=Sphingobacterium arenae TaxID=1280598 RepID=A0ABR7XZS4_9SPHI|nr:alpha-L-rhamnosidase C-terminal domain-containing protein [Sphingobacterium arenae]MBD1424548.1 alpha-L-rhamnosidase N-terminal domain-containing protein [Sphingobacterium arenae]